jgi:neopullulanase
MTTRRLLPPLFFALASVAFACSSDPDADPRPVPPGPVVGNPDPDAGPGPGEQETDIVFEEGTTFTARDCSLTLRLASAASEVKVAGEFTDWANGARAMTKSNDTFELTLAPGDGLAPGSLYAYKLIVDGVWRLDPNNKYRKLLDGQMNSALRMPACDAGPELLSGAASVARSGETGEMKVRVEVRAADDGTAPERMTASLDGQKIPAGAFAIDKDAGAVDFTLPGLAKGKHRLSLRAVDKQGRAAEPIDLPFWVEDEAFDYRDGLLYMFMMDRFANGEKANDAPVGAPVHYDADWHGGDLQGALAVMKTGYFEKLGVRTIWLSPINAQTSKYESGDGNQLYSAYHGYWPIKARDVEPRFGGDAAMRAFVKEAHARGLRVLLDLINNQVHKDHEYIAQNGSWFRTACKCGDVGCGWSERPFDCMFQPYLPDIDWTVYGAEQQFIADAVHWISEYDFDGFRVDAVKHVEANSIYNMRAELTRRFEQGGARIFMTGETAVGEHDGGNFFGEIFGSGFEWIDAYTGPTALDSQFDFPTRHNMADGLVSGLKPMNEVEGELKKAETSYRAENRHHVRFLNGHDNPRIASIAAQDPKLGCAWSSGCRGDDLPPLAYGDDAVYVRLRRALTALYTLPGVPFLYAGDEVGFGGGADPDMRRDMLFAEPELAAVRMSRPGTTPPALTAKQVALRDWARKLGETRAASRAIRRGDRKTLVGDDGDLWVYAYQTGPKEIAIVALNRGGAVNRTVSAGALDLEAVASWQAALGTGTATTSGTDLQIALGAGEAAIFIAQ